MHKGIQNIILMLFLLTNTINLFSQYTGGQVGGFECLLYKYPCTSPNPLGMYKGGKSLEASIGKQIQIRCQSMFLGGKTKDGHDVNFYKYPCPPPTFLNMYKGGKDMGENTNKYIQSLCIRMFSGGQENGFALGEHIETCIELLDMFLGGKEIGQTSSSLIQERCQLMFAGGNNGGDDAIGVNISNCPEPIFTDMYKGSLSDGFGVSYSIQERCQSMFAGGTYDGANASNTIFFVCPEAPFSDLYKGGQSDGFNANRFIQLTCNTFFAGGREDGFVVGLLFQSCPDLDVIASEDSVCTGESVRFSPEYTVHDYTNFAWFFEGGVPDTSTSKYPSINYPDSGLYDVMLIASNDSVSDTIRKTDFILVGFKTADPITASGPTSFCECGSVELTAPAGHTYTWSTGQTSQSITAFNTGTYKVTVDGCYVPADSVNVVLMDNNIKPQISTNGFDYNTIVLKTETNISYIWSPNGETVDSIVVNSTGTYFVETVDVNGCSKRSSKAKVKIGGVCNEAALGINLNYFSGIPINNEWVLTKWETFYEENNDFYTLERTKDNENWTIIATVKGNGTKKNKSFYQYYDRLKQTDFDGKSEYVGYIAVNIYPKNIKVRNIFPNPVDNKITYLINSDTDSTILNIEIVDVIGRILMSEKVNLRKGDNHNSLDVSEMESGPYFLIFNIIENKQKNIRKNLFTWKFIKL